MSPLILLKKEVFFERVASVKIKDTFGTILTFLIFSCDVLKSVCLVSTCLLNHIDGVSVGEFHLLEDWSLAVPRYSQSRCLKRFELWLKDFHIHDIWSVSSQYGFFDAELGLYFGWKTLHTCHMYNVKDWALTKGFPTFMTFEGFFPSMDSSMLNQDCT